MMLFKLSIKNILKSIKDYAIYFFTLILGVAIFYVFNAIDSQTAMLSINASTKQIIKTMIWILSGVSVFVSVILAFLIIYASRFLIKRRNKEFGTYLTLGMSKRKVSIILFFETLIIGLLSLIVGLSLGVVLSQFMSLLVAHMFEADLKNFAFVFSKQAFIKTIVYFSIMYLIVMIFNTIIIGKSKLIDLIYGNKKSEQIKIKNPYLSIIVFIISSMTLAYAYYMVTGGVEELLSEDSNIIIPIILGSVSTFFLFWSLSGLLLRICTSIKKFYYKGLNSFTLRQISSKINTMVVSVTVICLMLFVTICSLSSSLSIKNSMNKLLKELVPVDIDFSKRYYNDYMLDSIDMKENEIADRNSPIRTTLNNLGIDVNLYFKDITEYNIYSIDNITLGYTSGESREQIIKEFPFIGLDSLEHIMKVSDYNKVAKIFGKEEFKLNDNEYVVVANFPYMVNIRNMVLKNNTEISIYNHKLKPKYDEVKDGLVEISSNYTNPGIIIVPDDVIGNIFTSKYHIKDDIMVYNHLLANYNTDKKINDLIKEYANKSEYIFPNYESAEDIRGNSIGLGAIVTFISIYLGIIFLIASSAILALKELSESSDNRERYNIIREIGADEKTINNALFKQILIFFLLPLILALIHSVFGIKFCNFILVSMGTESLLTSIIMTAIFIILIYGGYFVITYICSKNIIRR